MYNQFFTKPRISEKKRRKQSCTPNIFLLNIVRFLSPNYSTLKQTWSFFSSTFNNSVKKKSQCSIKYNLKIYSFDCKPYFYVIFTSCYRACEICTIFRFDRYLFAQLCKGLIRLKSITNFKNRDSKCFFYFLFAVIFHQITFWILHNFTLKKIHGIWINICLDSTNEIIYLQ